MNLEPQPHQEHDEKLCDCATEGSCVCPCAKCCEFQKQYQHLQRLSTIEQRLNAAGIHVDDLSALIWMRIQNYIHDDVREMAQLEVKLAVQGMQLRSVVVSYEGSR